jgi:single-strand DNA-binding protein
MTYLNSVTVIGRVSQDPNIRYFESGAVKASVSMAVRPPYKAEEPQWFDVEAWGAQAEVIANYVRKGTGLAVKGELVFDHWVDKNTGAPRSKAFIRVKLLELLGSPRERQESGAATSEIPTPDLATIANAQF